LFNDYILLHLEFHGNNCVFNYNGLLVYQSEGKCIAMNSSDRPLRVLLTDAHGKTALATVKNLSQLGFIVGVVGSSPKDVAILSKYAQFRAIGSKDNFINILKKAVIEFKPDVLLPIGEISVKKVVKHRTFFEKHTSLSLPSQESIELALNKIEISKFLEENGINVPKFHVTSTIDEIKDNLSEFNFPIVLKGPSGSGSKEIRICKNEKDLICSGKELLNRHSRIMMQDYIDGFGTGYFGGFIEGEEIGFFMHKRLREYPISGGPSASAISIYKHDLHEIGRNCLELLKWNGVAMVEFRREKKTGKLWFIEVNPKFWGSLELSMVSGVNFPLIAISGAINWNIEKTKEYVLGREFRWVFPSEIMHLAELHFHYKVIRKMLSYNPRRVFYNISFKDPLPSLRMMFITLRLMIKKILRK
jgi:predicted ATP-grasp superfamily ATP-dependent carboligase